MIDDYQPSLICRNPHAKEEEIQIPGFVIVYHNGRSANSGAVLIKVRDNIKNISLVLPQEKNVGQC